MIKVVKTMLIMVMVLNVGCIAGVKKQDNQSIETLMIKSGLDKQLEQIGPMIQTGMMQQNQATGTLSQDDMNELNASALVAFEPNALKQTVQKHIEANLAQTDIEAVLAWLRSPLGEKITGLEEDASTPEAYAQMQKMAAGLAGNGDRVSLIKELDMAVKSTEAGVAVMLSVQRAVIVSIISAAPADKRPNIEDFDKGLLTLKKQIKPIVEQSTLMSMLYTYRSLSDSEIGKYIEFARSAPGRKYHSVTAAGVKTAVTNGAQVLGELMTRNAAKKSQATAPGRQTL